MREPNLFSRLADYSLNPHKRSLENFTTELLAHFFNTDATFKKAFARLLFRDQRMARPFIARDAVATTQNVLGRDCRVDLVLENGAKLHLVEVKIAAIETTSGRWGQTGKLQIQRYLDLKKGHVTYLTTSESVAPVVDQRGRRRHRFVKHALFEELYRALQRRKLQPLTKAFLEFMKDNGLAAPDPFSDTEFKNATRAMETVRKFSETLKLVRSEVNGRFRKNLKTYSDLTRPAFQAWDDGGGEVYCYLKKFRRGPVRSVGIALTPMEGDIFFDVWARCILHPSFEKMRRYLAWESYNDPHLIYSGVWLRGDHRDINRMVKHARQASAKLGRAIARFA